MRKFWLIFKHEYTRHVLRKRFLLVLLSVPLYLLFLVAMAILSVFLMLDFTPVGYIDYAGVIREPALPFEAASDSISLKFHAYNSEEEGRAAVREKRIQALYILPADYCTTLRVKVVYLKQPIITTTIQFRQLLRYNLLDGQQPAVVERVLGGATLDLRATSDKAQTGGGNMLKIGVPVAVGILLMAAIFTTSGYLVQAVVEEKENRTMEILTTSASPTAIMNGKVIALIMVGVTQLAFYVIPPLALLAWAASSLPVKLPPFDPGATLLMMATIIPTFVLISALMATVGATLTDVREGQQVMGLFSMVVMSPYFLVFIIAVHPQGKLALALSYFPLTASLTLLLRAAFGAVPPEQVAISTGLILLAAAGALWLSGRVFRMGMLRYGQRLALAEIVRSIIPPAVLPPSVLPAAGWNRRRARGKAAVPPSPTAALEPETPAVTEPPPPAPQQEQAADE